MSPRQPAHVRMQVRAPSGARAFGRTPGTTRGQKGRALLQGVAARPYITLSVRIPSTSLGSKAGDVVGARPQGGQEGEARNDEGDAVSPFDMFGCL